MTDEQAKAVQEVAKTTDTVADISRKIGGFFTKIFGEPLCQMGGILADEVMYFRYKNALNIADKVQALHVQRHIGGKTIPIPPKLAVPLLQSATLEDNNDLQDVWARLIANSTDPGFKQALHPGFIEVARQLSPDEAIMLSEFLKIKKYPELFRSFHQLNRETNLIRPGHGPSRGGVINQYLSFCKKLPLKQQENATIYFDNLKRLQVVQSMETQSNYLQEDPLNDQTSLGTNKTEYLRMTVFGERFMAACIGEPSRTLDTI